MRRMFVSKRIELWLGLVCACLVLVSLLMAGTAQAAGVSSGRGASENQLVRPFAGLEQPRYDAISVDLVKYPNDKLAEHLPFEVMIPELTGWSLAREQRVYYSITYTQRFFHSLYLIYQQGDAQLQLTIALHREPYLVRQSEENGFTYRDIKFTFSDFATRSAGHDWRPYEQVQWQRGEVYFALTVNPKGCDLATLAKACVDQLGEIKVQQEKIVSERGDETYILRSDVTELAPHFTERVFDLARLSGHTRSQEVIFWEVRGQQSLTFTYQGNGEFELKQSAEANPWPGGESVEKDGVTVEKSSYPTLAFKENALGDDEVYEKTIYSLDWSVEGYNFELSGDDEDQLWRVFSLINTFVRKM